jgi:hypothetical protein
MESGAPAIDRRRLDLVCHASLPVGCANALGRAYAPLPGRPRGTRGAVGGTLVA